MKYFKNTICLLLCVLCLSQAGMPALIPIAHAAYPNTTECLQQIYDRIAQEKRIERSVLFGELSAKETPEGGIRFDNEGNAWMKKDTNTWNSLGQGYETTTWSDGLMDDRAGVKPRRGIFEMKRATTSDLIPPVIQTFRAFQCRLRAVCMAADQAQMKLDPPDKKTISVQPEGCIAFDEPVFSACTDNTQVVASFTGCDDAINGVLAQETQILVLLTTYDSAYRTLLQFQGTFEGFLSSFRFALIDPLWQTVRVIGQMSHLPCFLSQCDE